MPKELTHWWLAAQALYQLPGDSPIRQLLTAESPAYLTGSVLPDTLLHLIFGSASPIALTLAKKFHEPEGNSFAPLIRFVEQQGQGSGGKGQESGTVTACLLGVASHMLADITFHPYICALSGDDIGLHYRYETELDLWLLQQGKQPPVRRLKDLMSIKVADSAEAVARGVFDPEEKLPQKTVGQALQLHSFIQGCYSSPGWQLLAKGLALLPVPFLRSHSRLFYPINRHRKLSWPEAWKQPATGLLHHASPELLLVQALERIVLLLHRTDEAGLLTALQEQPGENLITGIAA